MKKSMSSAYNDSHRVDNMSGDVEINEIFKRLALDIESNSTNETSSEKTIQILTKKVKELNFDISVLKRLIYMLNVELELRDSGLHEHENKQHIINSDKTENILLKTDINMIEPLLQAFEQTKKEKDELLADYKHSFDEVANRCKQAVHENDGLRQQLQETKTKVESTFSEWQKLHEKFLLVEEHNQLLIRQSKLFQNKIKSLETAYQQTLKQLEEEKKELCEKYDNTRTELLLLKGKHNAFCDTKNLSSVQSNQLSDVDLSSFMFELKNLSNEIKLQHANEVRIMKNRMKTLESEKCDLDIKLASITSERDHLEGYISAIEREMRKTNSEYENLKEKLKSTKESEGDAKKQILKCMSFIRELVSVHNCLLERRKTAETVP